MGMRLSFRSLFRRADWRDDLSAYVDDELPARERERVEAQLADSAEMQEYLADLQQMRSVLRSFDTAPSNAPSSVPFQLTQEMINDPARVPFQPTVAARALRLSMSTAAVGVATFAAVMIFDAVDSPTVTFTTTSAGDSGRGVPTAAVVTDEVQVEVEAEAQAAADAQPSAVTAVSATSMSSGSESAPQAESAEQQEAEQSAPADAIEVAEEAMQAEQQAPVASVAAVNGEAEQQEAAQQASYEDEAQQQARAEQASEDAASDPSRRALTAGSARGESDAEEVTAESVVAQQQASDAAPEASQDDASTTSALTTSTLEGTGSTEDASTESTAADSAERDRGDGQEPAAASTQSQTRTVATSVTHTESDWPLEQRPRSSTVQLATDPAWERPVQIVLAAIAISATVFWLVLTIVDRRRRA